MRVHVKDWIAAMRLRTLPLAIANIGMGNVLAAFWGSFSWMICFLSVLTAVLLQILSNLANDYGDSQHGVDGDDREGPARTVQTGRISGKSMRRAIAIVIILSLFSGVGLLYSSFTFGFLFLVFMLLGVVSILAALKYTAGKKPYGYRGFGDIAVYLFFGLLAVAGTFYLQTRLFQWEVLLPATSCGLFSVGVLNINNIRDISSDQKAGKRSIPVIIGRNSAVRYHGILLALGLLSSVAFTLLFFHSYWQFLFLLIIPVLIMNFNAVKHTTQPMALDPYLKQMAVINLIFVISFSTGLFL
jgi:1,4-dihydroxy-2-naphthoate octaprenyltransferase